MRVEGWKVLFDGIARTIIMRRWLRLIKNTSRATGKHNCHIYVHNHSCLCFPWCVRLRGSAGPDRSYFFLVDDAQGANMLAKSQNVQHVQLWSVTWRRSIHANQCFKLLVRSPARRAYWEAVSPIPPGRILCDSKTQCVCRMQPRSPRPSFTALLTAARSWTSRHSVHIVLFPSPRSESPAIPELLIWRRCTCRCTTLSNAVFSRYRTPCRQGGH